MVILIYNELSSYYRHSIQTKYVAKDIKYQICNDWEIKNSIYFK